MMSTNIEFTEAELHIILDLANENLNAISGEPDLEAQAETIGEIVEKVSRHLGNMEGEGE